MTRAAPTVSGRPGPEGYRRASARRFTASRTFRLCLWPHGGSGPVAAPFWPDLAASNRGARPSSRLRGGYPFQKGGSPFQDVARGTECGRNVIVR
jgi:hypothetical protein